MTRIIGGRFGGRLLATPRGSATRPTSDRVREALYSALEARGLIQDAAVLDLYAGSGALGLEAASRGAATVELVERDRGTARVAAGNARTLGVPARVHAMSVRAFARGAPARPADLVLADPPYPMGRSEVAADLAALLEGGWFGPAATLVLERSTREGEPDWPAGLLGAGPRRYGETTLWFATAADGAC